ncbi:Hypothetical predicted protein [Octopus vulgaris]|uniref:Uncharacterized protein n=1 Tax=Octopus vulgaris TaxID=6645 RepID=A0AA36B9B6_OCTVU|nr:Hypothetical predicted protein [Octopus vulgaris]
MSSHCSRSCKAGGSRPVDRVAKTYHLRDCTTDSLTPRKIKTTDWEYSVHCNKHWRQKVSRIYIRMGKCKVSSQEKVTAGPVVPRIRTHKTHDSEQSNYCYE